MRMNEAYELMKCYVPVKYALKVRAEGDMLIAANRNTDIYYLNGMACEIWGMIDGMINIEGLSSKILSEYDAKPEEVKNDIVNFIRDLQWKKLIRLKEVLS